MLASLETHRGRAACSGHDDREAAAGRDFRGDSTLGGSAGVMEAFDDLRPAPEIAGVQPSLGGVVGLQRAEILTLFGLRRV
jgi:hypothetical protein